jgi:hypothetical protein
MGDSMSFFGNLLIMAQKTIRLGWLVQIESPINGRFYETVPLAHNPGKNILPKTESPKNERFYENQISCTQITR